MKMIPLVIHLPKTLKARLDALRTQGYTASGYIRGLLEREHSHVGLDRPWTAESFELAFCRTRNSLACRSNGRSPISSERRRTGAKIAKKYERALFAKAFATSPATTCRNDAYHRVTTTSMQTGGVLLHTQVSPRHHSCLRCSAYRGLGISRPLNT